MPNEIAKAIMKNISKDICDIDVQNNKKESIKLSDYKNEKANNITQKEELLLKSMLDKSSISLKESKNNKPKKIITLDELSSKIKE